MTDANEKLESELLGMRPRSLNAELIAGIESALAHASRPWGDRFLIFAMGMGSLAACAIIGLLIFSGPTTVDFRPSGSLQPVAAAPMLGSYSLAAAQNGDGSFRMTP